MLVNTLRVALLAIVCVSLMGCGGGQKSSNTSLNAQFRKALTITDPTAKVTELLRISGKQHEAGDIQAVDTTLTTAANTAAAIEAPAGRAIALNRVAIAMARLERTSEAKEVLKQVRKTSEQITDNQAKVTALSTMARTYGQHLKDSKSAMAYLGICQETISAIEPPDARILAQLDVAAAYQAIGEAASEDGLMQQILEAARELEDPRKRADRLADAAAALGKMGKTDKSKAVFQETEAAIPAISDDLSRAYAFLYLSEKLVAAGDKATARKVLDLAESTADKVTDQSMKSPLLEKIFAARRST